MRIHPSLTLLLSGLLLAAPASQAAAETVYRYEGPDGSVIYTDEAIEGAERIQVKEVPTITLPKGEPLTPETLEKAQKTDKKPYERIEFKNPQPDSAFWSGSGDISVSVRAQPALKPGHRYRLTIDGKVIGTQASGTFNLQNMYRGTHQASVEVVDTEGDLVQAGPSMQFTLHRPSIQN